MNRTMTVAQLSSYLKCVFEDEELLHDVTLTGEVVDVSFSDKHTFLTLSDGKYSVRCVHFMSRDGIEKGMRVALRGSVAFYDRRTSVSFNYSEFFASGVGDKNIKYEQLKAKLAAAGYFENRPQLPRYVTRVIALTSAEGAAIRDFIRVVHDKCPFVDIRVCDVRVQGDGAAAMIADALRRLQNERTDAIVLCRGGGSDEDLDCFNDETLATAVATSRIPVISAVGHEVDYTLCDYCAGTRAGTPSIAGEVICTHARRIITDIADSILRIKESVFRRYTARLHDVGRLGNATVKAVAARVGNGYIAVRRYADRAAYALQKKADGKKLRLIGVAGRIRTGLSRRYAASEARLEVVRTKIRTLDPHRIIKIGYAAVLGEGGRITDAAELRCGQDVKLVFSDGDATATVTKVNIDKGNKPTR